VVGFLALYGVVEREDEGAAARTFQLLLAAQLPIIGFFAVTWLPRRGRRWWCWLCSCSPPSRRSRPSSFWSSSAEV
jgi:hypothetical protein